MHDIARLDKRGIPGLVVATEAFKPAALAQSAALGFTPEVVWVPHPIQNLSAAELAQLAGDALERILLGCSVPTAAQVTP